VMSPIAPQVAAWRPAVKKPRVFAKMVKTSPP
jgi:hypothetical protein